MINKINRSPYIFDGYSDVYCVDSFGNVINFWNFTDSYGKYISPYTLPTSSNSNAWYVKSNGYAEGYSMVYYSYGGRSPCPGSGDYSCLTFPDGHISSNGMSDPIDIRSSYGYFLFPLSIKLSGYYIW